MSHPVFLSPGEPVVLRIQFKPGKFQVFFADEPKIAQDVNLVMEEEVDEVRLVSETAKVNFVGFVEIGERVFHAFVDSGAVTTAARSFAARAFFFKFWRHL